MKEQKTFTTLEEIEEELERRKEEAKNRKGKGRTKKKTINDDSYMGESI